MSKGVLRLGHIERYVLARTLTGVGAALAVISFIIMLIDFVELSRTVGTRARDASVLDLFALALLQSPQVIVLLLPFAFLFGVLFAYMNLNRRSELIAMRAAGISAWRFILPAAMAAAVIGLFTVTAIHPLVSQMHAQFERKQATMMENYLPSAPKAIWLPPQGDGRNMILIRAGSRVGPGVRLKDVTMLVYRREADGGWAFSRRVDAQDARAFVEHGLWLPGQTDHLRADQALLRAAHERHFWRGRVLLIEQRHVAGKVGGDLGATPRHLAEREAERLLVLGLGLVKNEACRHLLGVALLPVPRHEDRDELALAAHRHRPCGVERVANAVPSRLEHDLGAGLVRNGLPDARQVVEGVRPEGHFRAVEVLRGAAAARGLRAGGRHLVAAVQHVEPQFLRVLGCRLRAQLV
ncbi:MAG: hypothetical protein B7Y99_11190, partial [Caulobacterales bacterium 32-69-10]